MLAVAAVAACRDTAGVDAEDGRCQQTGEFGNFGCFDVTGEVVGNRGQALGGISVGARFLPGDAWGFGGGYSVTNASGRFRFRAMRFVARPNSETGPDTLSVYVHAADPRSAGVNVPASVRDSVLTFVRVAAVGTVPEPVSVRITLPVP